ncbi:hypothetical protein [Methylobacterium sp. E-046]|uniref:hypothetical protein n=1 Tax=Methylobacterium sp. E-046 TaxID=2836576 RepID=UPI001FB95605|nr:hypothetical protein [Methylobacterium sp. E-046]MCJ2101224.1 hypothetical protein [Methylobacterium sp. E-046]
MEEGADPVREAVAVLQAHGYTVEHDEDFECWRIDGGEWRSLGDLLFLAICLGLNRVSTRLQ